MAAIGFACHCPAKLLREHLSNEAVRLGNLQVRTLCVFLMANRTDNVIIDPNPIYLRDPFFLLVNTDIYRRHTTPIHRL